MTLKHFPRLTFACILLMLSFSLKANPVSTKWATYFGGLDFDELKKVAVAPDGSLYVAGSTNSSDGIASPGCYQPDYKGGSNFSGSDAVVAKFTPDGNLVWATYYGGENSDLATGLAVDAAGNIYLSGWTASDTGIATPGAYQPARASTWAGPDRYDGFLAKFDPSGNRIWSTYVGGSNDGFISNPMGLCISPSGRVVLTMTTESTDMAVSTGCHQPLPGGGLDGYLIAFDTAGNRVFATYFGGAADDKATSVATDRDDNIQVAGYTESTSDIASPGSSQPVIAGGQDGFLAKFSSTGDLQWSTYCGGAALDRALAVTCDSLGSIYLAGVTLSDAGIATPGALQPLYGGGDNGDGFVVKYSPSGNKVWASYYGGSGTDQLQSIQWKNGNIYFAGTTSSPDNIATADVTQPVLAGIQDGFIAKVTDDGSARSWGSYYGGVDGDVAGSIAIGDNNELYICGSTQSATGVATPGAYQSSFGGGLYDGFVAKLKECLPFNPVIVQQSSRLSTTVPYTSYQWNEDGDPIAGATDSAYVVTSSGDYSVTVVTADGCSATSSVIHVAVTGITGITITRIQIYPNPVTDKLYMQTEMAGTFQFLAVDGRLLFEGTLINGKQVLDLKGVPEGIYLLTLKDREGHAIAVKKVMRR